MAPGGGAQPSTPLPGLGTEDYPGFPADVCPPHVPNLFKHCSTLADVLKESPALYEAMRERHTAFGTGLARCIKVGMDHRGHQMMKTIGMVAGDEECYETFRELLDVVIERHMGDKKRGKSLKHVPADLSYAGLTAARMDPTGRYVQSTQVRAWRCLSGFRFPPAMSSEERFEVERLISRACVQLPEKLAGEYFPLRGSQSYVPRPGGMDAAEEAALSTAGFLFEAPDSSLRLSSGAGRQWPQGRGVFADRARSFSVWVNEQEHLRVAATQKGDDLQGALRSVALGLDCLARSLGGSGHQQVFAYSDRLGFLTSDPANLGTAMQVSIMIELPLLATRMGGDPRAGILSWPAWCAAQRVHVRHACEKANTHLFELTSVDRLGCSEVHLINLLVEVVSRLVQMEQRLEASHPIDDLLASVDATQVLATRTATPSEVAVAQKARATLILGLETGCLFDALSIARPAAPQAPPRSGGGYDPLEATAKVVFESIFRTVVLDTRPALTSGEAEEVQSTSPRHRTVQVQANASVGPSRPQSSPEWSRPDTGGSAFTVAASSKISASAEEFVSRLIDAEETVHTMQEEAAEKELAAVRQRACSVLLRAANDGRLHNALTQVAEAQQKPAPEDASVDMGALRGRVYDLLLGSANDGRLEQALAEGKKAQEGKAEAHALRAEGALLLSQACHDGRLQQAMLDVRSEAKAEASSIALRASASNALRESMQNGTLELALREVAAEAAGQEVAPPPPASVVQEPAAPWPKALGGEGGGGGAGALVLQVVSARDRRIGELGAMIRDTQMRIVHQGEVCKQVEDMITAARHDLAHVELDIEWHRRALESADARSTELEVGHRKLAMELDCQAHKLRHHDVDAGPGMHSARSEISTATGGTMFSNSAYGAVGPFSPRPPMGLVLQPLVLPRLW